MSADEYLSLGETDERYELIDGVVVMSPSPFLAHQRVVRELWFQIESFCRRNSGVECFVETDVRFSASAVYRPDIVVYRSLAASTDPARLTTPPTLIVEVLLAGTKARDLVTKRDDYEKYAVDEYWTIDPEDGGVRCWERRGTRLIDRPIAGDLVTSRSLSGLAVDLRPVRALLKTR